MTSWTEQRSSRKGNVDGIDEADGFSGVSMEPGVEVTKGLAREGVSAALAAARHNVPTLGIHRFSPFR